MPGRIIRTPAVAHADGDCFYVSAERVRFPFLRHKPVGVLGNQGACVIAKSYEMKADGVRAGEPIWQAQRKCPDAVYVKRDFRWYEVLSRKTLDVLKAWSPAVEYYSIDEFFFEAVPADGKTPEETAAALQAHIRDKVGLPFSIGVGRSKTLAKLFSDSAKPNGVRVVLDRAGEEALLAELPVDAVSGIARARAARLAAHGIHTCLQLARADRPFIRKLLTCTGEALWWELNGEAVLPLHTERPPHKIISRGGSLGEKTADPERLLAWLARNTERLVEALEFHAVKTEELQVYLGHAEGPGGQARVALLSATDRFEPLLEAARIGLRQAWRGTAVERMHLLAVKLARPGSCQRSLFDPPPDRDEAVARLKREVNGQVGRFALRSGATLPLYGVYRDSAQSYDICDVAGKMCF